MPCATTTSSSALERADALDLHVVLVGPHERHRRERLARRPASTSRRSRRGTPCSVALVQCSSRIDSPSEQRVRPAGDVARGDDAGRGEAGLVAHHAVVDREPAAVEPVRRRYDADADDEQVGVDRACRRRGAPARPGRRLRTPRPTRRGAGRRRGRGAARRTPRRSPRPSPRTIGCGSASSTVTSRPRRAARRRHLRADEPGADHDDPRAGVEPVADRDARRRACAARTCRRARRWSGRRAGRGAGGDHAGRRSRQAVAAVELDARGPRGRARSPSPEPPGRARARRRPACAGTSSSASRSPASKLLRQRRAGRTAGGARRRRARSRRREPRAPQRLGGRAAPRATRPTIGDRCPAIAVGTVAAAFASDEPDCCVILAALVRAARPTCDVSGRGRSRCATSTSTASSTPGRSRSSAPPTRPASPNTGMTTQGEGLGRRARRRVLPRAPQPRVGARGAVRTLGRRRARRPRPRGDRHRARRSQSLEEVVERKATFAVIFAAGFAETGAEGAPSAGAPRASSCAAATPTCSGPTPTSTRSRSSAPTSTGAAIALITQSGHQGRPIFQGQELGIRLAHWAPTGNEVDLEFADFVRYFADQPEVGVIAAYIEGFKDGRSLDARRRPRRAGGARRSWS